MKSKIRFDLSRRRFHPIWLIIGAIVGRAVGLFWGLNLNFWYFATPGALIGWQIFGAIACALLCSFMMTSNVSLHTKGAILGLGIGFGVSLYGGELWSYGQTGRTPAGLQGMIAAEGIFLDWLVQHSAWLGLVIGWIIGAVVSRRRRSTVSVESVEGD